MARQGVRKMKKIAVLMMMLFLCVSVYPVQDQLQRRFSFSLSGGIIGGKINFAGNIFYAREFEKGLFIQGSGFVLGKEYGTSLGFGLSGENFGIYVFGESLYHQKMFFQIRPAVRLRFPWLSLAASYAVPVGKSTITINGEQVSASKYWGGEVNVVPVDWARIYTEVMSVESVYTRWRVGAEIRPLNWLSVSADWNKTNSGLYSQWTGYQDLRVALNFLLGSQRQSFKPNQRIQMQPQYPILTVQKSDDNKPPTKDRDTVEFMYERVLPVISPQSEDPSELQLFNEDYGGKTLKLTKTAANQWTVEAEVKYSGGQYIVFLIDPKVIKEYTHIARKIYIRIKGKSDWIELTCIRPNTFSTGEQAEFIIDARGIRFPSY